VPKDELCADFYVEELVHVDPVTGEETWREIDLENEEIELGLKVKFDGSLSTGAYWYVFDYGGNVYSTDVYSPTDIHNFTMPGNHAVNLQIWNEAGDETNTSPSKTIHVAQGMQTLSVMPFPGERFQPMSFVLVGNRIWALSSVNKDIGTADISDPNNLPALQTIQPDGLTNKANQIAIGNGKLSVSKQQNGLDIYQADPDNFILLKRMNANEFGNDISGVAGVGAVGNIMYVNVFSSLLQQYRLLTYDISNPSQPSLIKEMPLPAGASQMRQVANDALVFKHYPERAFTVFDIREPTNPEQAFVVDMDTSYCDSIGVTQDRIAAKKIIQGTEMGVGIWKLIVPESTEEPLSIGPKEFYVSYSLPLGFTENRMFLCTGDSNVALRKYDTTDQRLPPYSMGYLVEECGIDGFVFDPDGVGPAKSVLITGSDGPGFAAVSMALSG